MKTHGLIFAVVLAMGASAAQADVFSMGGGLTSLEFVTVGNPGNAPDTHGDGYGAVDYTYRMAKFEVTAGQYTEFLNAVADTDIHGLYDTDMWNQSLGCKIQRSDSSGSYTYSVASDWANRPVNYVSWGDSARFANWLTNGQPTGAQDLTTTEDGSYFLNGATTDVQLQAVTRKTVEEGARYLIPSEDEWYKAAYHKNDGVTGNYFDYPTGSNNVPSNDLINPDPGNNANFRDGDYTIGHPYYLTEVGEFENSESPYGTFDQGGNLWEWNEWIAYSSYRGVRGGPYSGGVEMLHATIRGYSFPGGAGELDDNGFRVAYIPEPATLALMAAGLVAVWMRKRRVTG